MFDERIPDGDDGSAAEDVRILKALAATYLLFQRAQTASSITALALLLAPSAPEALRLQAIAALDLGRPDEALAALAVLEAGDGELPDDIDLVRSRALAMQEAEQTALRPVNARA